MIDREQQAENCRLVISEALTRWSKLEVVEQEEAVDLLLDLAWMLADRKAA